MILAIPLAGSARSEDDTAFRPVEAITPIAPALPEAIVAAIQESRFDAAVAALDGIVRDEKRPPDDRAFFAWIRGIALRRAGRLDDAAVALRTALAAFPGSAWTGKLRGELAGVELARKHPDDAERLARAEVEALLNPARKDRLAAVVERFAARLLEPGDPLATPDPEAAYSLLSLARALARGDEARARILFRMATASRAAGKLDRAAADLRTYLADHPNGADHARAQFQLGEVLLLDQGQREAARSQWSALARQLDAAARSDAAARDLRARCLYEIGRSYLDGLNADDRDARNRSGLGIAALRRFLAAEPGHALAVEAAYQIADAERQVGRSDPALVAYRAFLDGNAYRADSPEARRRQAELAAQATFQVGRILQQQGRLTDAAAAYTRYIDRFPSGPNFADAQRSILDIELDIADDHDRHGRFEAARAARETFVARNPLDRRVPLSLFRNGRSLLAEGQADRAVAAWENLIARFPADTEAGRAHWEIARIFEEKKTDPARAIEQLRKIVQEPWQSKARERIAILEAKSLVVVTPRSFRTGEVPSLQVTTRNIAALTVSAYRLDAEDYFRKKHAMRGVESLDIDLVAPEHTWSEPVPGHARYVPIERKLELKPIAGPGAWVVKVADDATLRAVTLVLVSDVEAIVKSSRDQVLVFAQDPATGRGRAGATVLAADPSGIILTGRTGADGVLLASWPKPRDPGKGVDYLVLDGPHVAATGFATSNAVAQGLTPRALITTERPAYRPGQRVGLRGIVREVKDGQYDARRGATYRLEVIDSRGRAIVGREVVLSAFGTFQAEVPLDASAPLGTYRVRVYQPGRSDFGGSFEVQAYRLAKAELAVELASPVVFRGEPIPGHAAARYPDGTPMADRPVEVRLPDGRTLRGRTGPDGRFAFNLSTEGFGEAQPLRIVARLTDDEVEAAAVAALAVQGFAIEPETARSVYLSGESFPLRAVVRDASGKPMARELSGSVIKRILSVVPGPLSVVDTPSSAAEDREGPSAPKAQQRTTDHGPRTNGQIVEREVSKLTLRTAADTGAGSVTIKIDDDEGGPYILRLSGTDRFGNPVIAERAVLISGSKDADRLRLLSDRLRFRVGEPARVNLHNRGGSGTALVAWEADRIVKYRLVPIRDGDNPIAWDVEGSEFPNVTLTATRTSGTALHQSRIDLTLDRDLRVTLVPARPVVKPGEPVELEVTTRDQLGRPVSAELSLAMVDRALLARFGDPLPPIQSVFYNQSRTGAFSTRSTGTFRYAPAATTPAARRVDIARRADAPDAPTRPPAPQPDDGRDVVVARPHEIRVGQDARSQAVLKVLDEPISMSFANETPLDDILKYIKQATTTAAHPGLQIYVDPVGLQEAERSMNSTVQLDLEGIPLKTTLRLALKQIGLTYKVEDGLLIIISEGSEEEFLEDMAARPGEPGRTIAMGGMGGMMGGMGGGGRGPVSRPQPPGKDRAAAAPAPGAEGAAKPEAKAFAATAPARESFVETAYWNPSVITDMNGRARVTFRAPSALAEYRLAALGVTGSDTMVGQSTAGLSVRQPFHIELRSPSVLNEGDQPRLPARLHHPGIGGRAHVALTVEADGRKEVFPKVVDLSAGGVTEVLLDAFRVPGVDRVKLSVSASSEAAGADDEVAVDVPVRAWGLPVFATASGRSGVDATVFVALPPERRYENPEMRIALSPRADRMLVELALDESGTGFGPRRDLGCLPVGTTRERAGDLLGAAAALSALRAAPPGESDAAARLSARIAERVTAMVTAQNQDGSWPWIPGEGRPAPGQPEPAGDLAATARVVWTLSAVATMGLGPAPEVLDRSTRYLEQALARLDAGERATRSEVLHALALRNRARFESVNVLLRDRAGLTDRSLAYLALTLARLDHAGTAAEVFDLLSGRAKIEPVGPGLPPRRYWLDGVTDPDRAAAVETTAIVALAFARIRPGSPEATSARDWLLAHRVGNGWRPAGARGVVLQALAAAPGDDRGGEDRYRLVVTVNDAEVFRGEVRGAAPGREVVVPRAALKPAGENRVAFDIEGRGTFGYAVTLSGITRDFAIERAPGTPAPVATIRRRVYLATPPELDGRPLATGFDAAVRPWVFENRATRGARGGRVRVEIEAECQAAAGRAVSGEPIVLHEYLPAGTSVVPGSVRGEASLFTVSDGVLTFYFSPGEPRFSARYELRGDLPGRYRVLPATVRPADDPGRGDFGQPAELSVLAPGDPATDTYRPTPDELYDRGKRHFDAGRLADADAPLESLFGEYTLRDDILKETARMLLFVHLARHDSRRVVRDFEIVREKSPDLFLAFDTLLAIGRAYAEIGETERAYLGWTALAEASYQQDARVGELLRQRARGLEGVAFLLRLWRESPGGSVVDSDLFGLAQLIAGLGATRTADGAAKADLSRQATRLTETFLAGSPGNPMADEAGLALVAIAFELGDHARMVEIAGRFARIHPASPTRDRFLYGEALGEFHLGRLDRAIAVARQIAEAPASPDGDRPEAAATRALALLGRIHEARLEPAEALAYYRRVDGRIRDAAEAVEALTSRSLRVPEITIVRPAEADPSKPAPAGRTPPAMEVSYRNLAELDVRVYPVDLLRLLPGRDDLGSVATVDLAGIRPVHQAKLAIGDGHVEVAERTRRVELPTVGEGAYLVILRGDDRFASGLVVVSPMSPMSPMELEVTTSETGRIRIAARDARTRRGVPGATVKVIGARDTAAQLGETDLRGVFVADPVDGRLTVVARSGAARYAIYRSPPEDDRDRAPSSAPGRGRRPEAAGSDPASGDDLRVLDRQGRERQIQRLEKRGAGGMGGAGMGGMTGGGMR
jgi:TolA-binding protein